MIWVDFTIIGLVGMALIVGVLKGFSQQSFSLICWLVAILVALTFSHEFSLFLKSSITDRAAKMAASFTLLCFITLLVGGLVRLLLGEKIKKSSLSIFDRLGGMVLGVAHGMVFVTVIIFLSGLSVLPASPWWKQSKLIPFFQAPAIWLRDYIPSDFSKQIQY